MDERLEIGKVLASAPAHWYRSCPFIYNPNSDLDIKGVFSKTSGKHTLFLFFQLVLKNLATNLFFHLLNCVKFELDIQHFTRVIDLIQFLNPGNI